LICLQLACSSRLIDAEKNNATNIFENNENDVGNFIETYFKIRDDNKFEVVKKSWMLSNYYNFKNDVQIDKRPFLFKWFSQFPWLVYSRVLKGALCVHCVLFRAHVKHGSYQASFISKPFVNFQKIS